MSSSPVDKTTMNKASSGAQGVDSTLQNGAASNQAFQNTQRQAQFGNGGTLTGFMNPNSLNVTSPTGAFGTQYTNEANQVNQGTNQALASTNRSMANHGGGMQPSGFGSAQTLSAYQNAANQKSDLFAQNTMAQQNQAQSNFWNANNAYSQTGQQAGSQALQGLGTAAGSYDNMYGTSSQQKQNPWAVAGSVLANGAGGAASLKRAF